MGLDIVELVIDVEERFGTRIPDAHAERIRTAGDLYLYVLGRVQRFKDGSCRSATIFYRLRTALMNTLNVERRRVRPDVPVAELLGGRTPHSAWQQLQKQIEFNLPGLRYPKWLLPISWTVLASVVIVAFAWSMVAACVLSLVALLPIVFLNRWAQSRARVPTSCSTVGGLVGTIVTEMPRDAETEPAAVWDTVRQLISEITGIPRDSVTRESRLVEDLNMG